MIARETKNRGHRIPCLLGFEQKGREEEAPLKTLLLKSHQKNKRVLASTKDKDLGLRQSFHTHCSLSQTLRKGGNIWFFCLRSLSKAIHYTVLSLLINFSLFLFVSVGA